MKRLLPMISAVTVAFYAACAFAQQALPQAGPGMGYGRRHFMSHPLGSLFMLLLCFLILALILRLFGVGRRWRSRGWSGPYGQGRYGQGPRGNARALDILEERFARGEIQKDEFEEKRKLLGG